MVDLTGTGHLYELSSMDGTKPQKIQFIQKESIDSPYVQEFEKKLGEPALVTVVDGTTNEEVLKMLIDRTRKLGEKLPCRENSLAVTKLEEALMWFEKRTANRLSQGVENTHQPHR